MMVVAQDLHRILKCVNIFVDPTKLFITKLEMNFNTVVLQERILKKNLMMKIFIAKKNAI